MSRNHPFLRIEISYDVRKDETWTCWRYEYKNRKYEGGAVNDVISPDELMSAVDAMFNRAPFTPGLF